MFIDYVQKYIYFDYPCNSPKECSPYEIKLKKGLYYLEAWGAQGGNSTARPVIEYGGFGGYSAGVFFANQTSNLYLHIGATANTSIYYGQTYNGGAKGLTINDGSGGGATDFRTKSGGWDSNFDSRILIAGGGGGAYSNEDSVHFRGGRGGGLNGETDASGKAPYGTQNGCEGNILEMCGTYGKGTGNKYGGGGGGKYGGGTTPNGSNGGGGGSGSVDGVYELGKYKKISDFSTHTGFGSARITCILLIDIPSVCVCNYMHFAQYLHILFSIVVS